MIHSFKTRQEEVNFVKSNGLDANYLSHVQETGKTSYKYREPIKVGDYLHVTGQIDTKASSDVIGVCAVPELMLPDGKARFVSIKSMDNTDMTNGSTTNKTMMWDSNASSSWLTFRTKVPFDGTSSGTISGSSTWGRIATYRTDSSASSFTIANTQDMGTKYYSDAGTSRIPSPYAPDGSFNSNYLYTDGNDDDWALLDYRGDKNTAYVMFSQGPGEETAPAFYSCGNFCPGYRDKEWYLPAIGELAFLAPRIAFINSKIEEAISAGAAGVVLPFGRFWSSSECSQYDAWLLLLSNGSVDNDDKGSFNYVRAFIAS